MKIFSDRKYLPKSKNHVVILCPFWGKNGEEPRDPSSGRFDRYMKVGNGFFEMVLLDEADLAIFPTNWENVSNDNEGMSLAIRFIKIVNEAGKRVIIFFGSDSDEEVPIEEAYIFRTSIYRSIRKPNEFAMPAWSEDFVQRYMGWHLKTRAKCKKPIISFCGYAPSPTWRQNLKRLFPIGKKNPLVDRYYRKAALEFLKKSKLVETSFIIRKKFYSQAASLPSGDIDYIQLQKLREEYVQNMINSDYVLCVRGAGNFSYRLYEALSCGRIPVFVDTDCVLPYQESINWRNYCIWVDAKEVRYIGERVAEFHASLSDQAFIDLQWECRRLWENFLSPEGFFQHFHKHFR